MSYSYKVYREEEKKEHIRYTMRELEDMGTFMLRDICTKEKIMTRSAALQPTRMSREELIELLYRYRGRQEEALRDDFVEESIQILEKITAKLSVSPEKIEIPFKIAVKKEIPLLASNQVQIIHGLEGELLCGLLLDNEKHIRALFQVEGKSLTLSPHRMDVKLEEGLYYDWQFLLFDGPSTRKLVQAYNEQFWNISLERSIVAVKARVPIFEVEKPQVSDKPLFIDFGTSNTCAATADEDGKLQWVMFQGGQILCQSCAAVKNCSGKEAEFLFGQEALDLIQKDGYGSNITFLHNIKKFLYEEQKLEVCDAGGNAASISSDRLLHEYFNFIINTAKAVLGIGFKEIRVLTPEKRAKFVLDRMKAILTEYQIGAVESESLNSVYYEIADSISDMEPGNRLPVLVLHCGGGGMSLIDCSYRVSNTEIAYEVLMQEQYLNGDNGFGGNNLTFLILQYLKIRLFLKLTDRTEAILGERFQDAYTWVDEVGTTAPVYEAFYALYDAAEAIIPTGYEQPDEFRQYKKQNFFRLWFLAEQIKILFSSDHARSSIRLPEEWREYCSLNVWDAGKMREYPIEIEIQKDEVWSVIAPEIYRSVKNFLEPYCNEFGILQGYRIKFSGLSCNIPVFRDAIREFTVGRRARGVKGGRTAMKLRAMEGAVKQEQLLKNGRIIPEIKHMEPAISYTVVAQTHDGSNIRIISGDTWEHVVFGTLTRHISTREVAFQIYDTAGQAVRKRTVQLHRESFERTDYEELFQKFPALQGVQGEIDSIGEKDIRLFVFRDENWDFCVLPLSRKEGKLYWDKVNRFLFDDISEDFFCGKY